MISNNSSMKSLRAYGKIRDMILTGVKLPGTRLILTELESELDIGRGPIREALMRLDRSGLVKNIPYKGAIVATPPTRQEITHIYDLRVDLEVKLALEAMKNLGKAEFKNLDNLLKTMEDLPEDHYIYDHEFHNQIYKASNLPHLVGIAQTLSLSVESVLTVFRWDKEICKKVNTEHRAIVAALKANDVDGVSMCLEQNIKNGLNVINETYARIHGIA
ncbi:MAG: GntR family transcriptional regulator [Desulfobacterium sp.]|nr:GntR family transcriptional regulator [Desulfobacterium sp.]